MKSYLNRCSDLKKFHPVSLSSSCVCSSSSSRPVETTCFSCSAAWCPLLPTRLLSFYSFNKDFITQLSHRLTSTLKEQKRKTKEEEETEEEREEEKGTESREVQSHVEGTGLRSPR